MANLAFSQRIEQATVGALRARWASHSRQSRLERSAVRGVDRLAGRHLS